MKTTRNHGLMRAPVLLTVAAAAGLVFLTMRSFRKRTRRSRIGPTRTPPR